MHLKDSAMNLKLGWIFTFQQDNYPKHKAKATLDWLNKKKINVLEWPSQSPDLNPIEHLCWDLKVTVHRWSPSYLAELEQFSHEEWENISPSHCAKLVETYPKRLIAAIATNGVSTNYWPEELNTFTTSKFWFVDVFCRYSWHVTSFNYHSVSFDFFSYE